MSSTAEQGRKLLAACSDPNAALGGAQHAYVIYVIPAEDVELQTATLLHLTAELNGHGLSPAESGTIGLSITPDGLWAELSLIKKTARTEILDLCTAVQVTEGSKDGARPLYIIPFDPAAAANQSPAELAYCKRLLSERLCTYSMGEIGRADVPDNVHITGDDAVRSATFNTSVRWRARELVKLREQAVTEIYTILDKGDLRGRVRRSREYLELNLADQDQQRYALSLLARAPIDTMADRLLPAQLTLDEADNSWNQP